MAVGIPVTVSARSAPHRDSVNHLRSRAENPSQRDESDQRRDKVGDHECRQLHALADRRVEAMQHEQRSAGDGQAEREHQQAVQLMARDAGASPNAEGERAVGRGVGDRGDERAVRLAACAPIAGEATDTTAQTQRCWRCRRCRTGPSGRPCRAGTPGTSGSRPRLPAVRAPAARRWPARGPPASSP